jgi:hypothetical protein
MVASSAKPATIRIDPPTRKPFHRPRRVMSMPDTVDEIIEPMIIGRVSRPAAVGEWPRAIWKYWPRKTAPPKSATPTAMLATTASVVVRSRKSRSGMIGSFALVSTSTAAPSRTTPSPTSRSDVRDPHANSVPASVTQMSRSQTPPAMSAAPR